VQCLQVVKLSSVISLTLDPLPIGHPIINICNGQMSDDTVYKSKARLSLANDFSNFKHRYGTIHKIFCFTALEIATLILLLHHQRGSTWRE
jgi:hypothetical protein